MQVGLAHPYINNTQSQFTFQKEQADKSLVTSMTNINNNNLKLSKTNNPYNL